MNMYVWDEFFETGLEFSPGLAVALASSVEEARLLIHKQLQKECDDWNNSHYGHGGYYDNIRVEKELQKPYRVFSSPAAVVGGGGS